MPRATIVSSEEPATLDVAGRRLCDCPPNHLNCLSAREWLRHQYSVWQFAYEKRDLRDRRVHPAVFPVRLAERVIRLFSHRGELVVDPFCGSGTTGVAARDLEREFVGFDIVARFLEVARERIGETPLPAHLVHDDARNAARWLPARRVSCVFTSPPYANVLTRPRANKSQRERNDWKLGRRMVYTEDDPRDLGHLSPVDFVDQLATVIDGLHSCMAEHGHVVVNLVDIYRDGERQLLSAMLAERLRPRWKLANVIIWDRTNLVNRMGIIGWPRTYVALAVGHELLLDFVPR